MGYAFETIWFLSDYGLTDESVGVVKAVIRGIAPQVAVIDLSHRIPPHDVRAASLALARSMQYLGSGVVLAVVDPGVGSARRAVAVEVSDSDGVPTAVLVGPDNGLLAPAVAMAGGAGRAVALSNARYHLDTPGLTFAGRDIFAPAVAHLCTGVDLETLGDRIDPLSLLPGLMPLSRQEGTTIVGEVFWVDRFGNVQLNIDPEDLPAPIATDRERSADPGSRSVIGDPVVVKAGGKTRVAVRVKTYQDLQPGQVGILVDAYGLLALVCQQRSAAQELGLGAGDVVSLEAYSG